MENNAPATVDGATALDLEETDDTCRHGVSFDEWCAACLAEMHAALG